MAGPLIRLRVLELAGIGPGPHAAMVLGDLGADVVRVERPDSVPNGRDQLLRNREVITLDLESPDDRDAFPQLAASTDVLIDGFRPGVTERLGIGPKDSLSRSPGLIYARMTGWGQDGPLADRADHDINYIALTGALHAIGRADERPVPPLNLVGDFGGGSVFLLVGILSALWERERSGEGQVVDAAMADGVGVLLQMMWSLRGSDEWSDQRESNLIDGGAPFHDTYLCADGNYVAVGAIEAQFYAELLTGLDLRDTALPDQHDRAGWPERRKRFADVFATRTRDEWDAALSETDACVTPVLRFDEVHSHPHMAARRNIVETGWRRPSRTGASVLPDQADRSKDAPAGSGRPRNCSRPLAPVIEKPDQGSTFKL